jgi:hypothetical protein
MLPVNKRVKLSASLRAENLQGFPDTFYLICREPTPYVFQVVGYQYYSRKLIER